MCAEQWIKKNSRCYFCRTKQSQKTNIDAAVGVDVVADVGVIG